MLKEYLAETYGYNEPIFISEVKFQNMNNNALRQHFKRLTKSEDLMRFDTGIYYLPKQSTLLKKSYLNPLKVARQKYIERDSNTFGFFSGTYLANQLRLTTQMPAIIEITTNNESTKGRIVTMCNQRIRLKRPVAPVTSQNVALLQLLDALSTFEKYAEVSTQKASAILKQYILQNNLTRSQLAEILPYITAQTSKKLIEWGLIYEFT